MWDFPGGRDGGNRYLVLGLGTGQAADLAPPPGRDELIAYGPLLSESSTYGKVLRRASFRLGGRVVYQGRR
jgi:hypothetical protein